MPVDNPTQTDRKTYIEYLKNSLADRLRRDGTFYDIVNGRPSDLPARIVRPLQRITNQTQPAASESEINSQTTQIAQSHSRSTTRSEEIQTQENLRPRSASNHHVTFSKVVRVKPSTPEISTQQGNTQNRVTAPQYKIPTVPQAEHHHHYTSEPLPSVPRYTARPASRQHYEQIMKLTRHDIRKYREYHKHQH